MAATRPSVSSTSRVIRIVPPRWPGSFLSRALQALLGRLRPLELDLDQGFPRQQPGIVGELGQTLAPGASAPTHAGRSPPSAGVLGVGFDLLAAKFELLTTPARAGRIGVDRRHHQPLSSKKKVAPGTGIRARGRRGTSSTTGHPARARITEDRGASGGIRLLGDARARARRLS